MMHDTSSPDLTPEANIEMGGGSDPTTAAFAERKARAVTKAEALVQTSSERLRVALREYEAEVARHEERGDGFFPHSYLAARKEAVLASKQFEARTRALATARAEQAAPTLALGGA